MKRAIDRTVRTKTLEPGVVSYYINSQNLKKWVCSIKTKQNNALRNKR